MQVYVINLDRRPDRLQHMNQQLEQLGISFERIAANDGMDPAVALMAKQCAPGMNGKVMPANAYACFQSHRSAWRRISESSHPYGIVMEDDLILKPGISEMIRDSWVPSDTDIVKLETCEVRLHVDKGDGIRVGTRSLRRLRSRHAGTGCYVISRKTAGQIYSETEHGVCDPVDEYLFNPASPLFSTLTIYQIFPSPAIQGDRHSAGQATETWAKSSMKSDSHFSYLTAATGEGAAARWRLWQKARRHLREQIKALRMGTKYTVARHG